ncbi:MAG: ribbon-helix-helix protein, CopG family [Actinobacteria bacterium]|nr:ribbon-helix-helix protein, CopG family [Actinomycetota bacterium]
MARKQVLVQLDDDLVEALDAAAEEAGLSRSELLRTAARALLESRVIARDEAALVAAYRRRPQDPLLVETARRLAAENVSEW